MAIKLGSKVRDTITGLQGTAIARTEWLHGCVRVTVQPNALRDGKPIDTSTFDEPQLELVEESATPPAPPRHGDRPNAARRSDPGR